MSRWTKKAAIEQMRSNALLQEALQAEPRLHEVLDEAVQQRNVPGYHRLYTYSSLKSRLERLVGWYCSKAEIRTERHDDAVLQTLDDVLPPDTVDLYPEGKEEE